ncbi:MAG: serpin family protein, partial [Candidatus Caldatribacteriaceae bacterium]
LQEGELNVDSLAASDRDFAFHLFSSLTEENLERNLFISPYSIVTALRMLYNGVAGQTQEVMAETMNIADFPLESLNRSHRELTEELNALRSEDPAVSFFTANSLWAQENVPFREEFLLTNENFYRAQLYNVCFEDPHTLNKINAWVRENTQEKIEKILEKFDPQTIMVLLNAIFFQAAWQIEFDPQKTQNLPFTLLDGKVKEHPMMYQEGEYLYLEDEEVRGVVLPYGKTGRVCMYLFLPSEGADFREFLRSLNEKKWVQWRDSFRKTKGTVIIPRFRVEYGAELKPALESLGMGILFTGEANLSRLTPINAFVSSVLHRAVVEVNEEGTEAAAATAVVVTKAVALPSFQFIANRPFFFLIQDQATKAILFMGCVVDPQD